MGPVSDRSPSSSGVADEAWGLMVGVFMSMRASWLAASVAEGLTPPQAITLMRLRPEDPPSLGDLAKQMHCDASYATALADRLEERGFAERRVSAGDRRVKELVPTPAGLVARERLRTAYLTGPSGLADLTEEEAEIFHRIATRLSESVDPSLPYLLGLPVTAPPVAS
jgi:DNA-binding MarR family transcriptional regulator